MNDSDFIETSLQPSKCVSATKRCSHDKTSALPNKKLLIESDCLFAESNENRCYVCNKDLQHLDGLRRALHINNCLDQQESKAKFEADKEKWMKTIDCPICGVPLQPGPFRAAHAKNCGRKHEVSGAKLLTLIETQTKVADIRKKSGMTHTKMVQPKLTAKKHAPNKDEPRSEYNEELSLALALSASENPSDEPVSVPEPKLQSLRSRKLRPRSYSFIEMEPRSCRCEVFEQIQQNFLEKFKMKRRDDNLLNVIKRRGVRSSALLGDINKCIRKLERLERLADDLKRFSKSSADVTIFSLENEVIPVHRFIIQVRAPRLVSLIESDGTLPLRDYSALALRCYVQFLYSSSIEWTSEETSDLLKLATAYGPVELISLCQPQQTSTSTDAADLGNSANKHSNSNDCSGQNQAVMKADKCEADKDECLSSKTFEVNCPSTSSDIRLENSIQVKNIPKEDVECLNIHGEDANSVTNSDKAEVPDSKIGSFNKEKTEQKPENCSEHILENKLKRRSKRILNTTMDSCIKTDGEASNPTEVAINEGNKNGIDAEKKQDSDSDESIVFVDEVKNSAVSKVRKINDESDDWGIDSGKWLEDLLADASSSSKKIVEAEAPSAHKDPNDSDDVFEFLPSDDDDDNKNLKADSSPKHLVNNQVKETVSSQKLSSSNSNEEVPRRSDSNSHVSQVIRNTESADSNQNIEEDFSKMAASESLNRSLVYSPLPLPHDSFDDAIRLSPQLEIPSSHSNHQTKHQQCTEESSKNQNDLRIGFGSNRKHKSSDCLLEKNDDMTKRHHDQQKDHLVDSFDESFCFESPSTQPTTSASHLPSKHHHRNYSSRTSDALCSPIRAKSPSHKKRQKLPKHSEELNLKHRNKAANSMKSSLVYDNQKEALQEGTVAPFGVPLSPIQAVVDNDHCTKNTLHSEAFSNALSPVIETRKDSIPTKNAVQYCSTPNQPTSTSRLAQRLKELGSNVKIVKTTNITPIPEYANMTDKQLEDELAKYGLRPMGKKRAIALLKKIYDELHPVIDLSSPVSSKPKRSIVATKLLDRLNEVQEKRRDERKEDEANERDEDLAEKTLNRSLNEEDILEESCIDDVYDEDAPLPKDLDGMQVAVLNWLRRNDNEDLYNEVLGLNTVSFEDFYGRLSKCDTAVAKIPRKALMEILDRLHITFSLPADGWKKRREKKQKLK